MGGENEIVTPPAPAAGGVPVNTNGLRVHKNGSEVHFHDDTGGLKAAVPVHVWAKVAFDLASLQRHTWEYLDTVNETLLTINITNATGPDGRTEVYDMVHSVKRVTLGPTIKAMSPHLRG